MDTNSSRASAWTNDEVPLLRWPAQERLRQQLAAAERPRLLLLTRSCEPPEVLDCFEDWIREPASAVDLEIRRSTLATRVRSHDSRRS